MKGIVFTEFLDMVEAKYGYEIVDQIITNSELMSNGIYTSIGTYHHGEMVQLLSNLSLKTNESPDFLLQEFGKYIFDTFFQSYPQFFEKAKNTFEFLSSIDNHIHVEVMKLYPDANLPRFESTVNDQGQMIMIYSSERKMSHLAMGLIEKTIVHYKEDLVVMKEDISKDGSKVKFVIEPK